MLKIKTNQAVIQNRLNQQVTGINVNWQ